MAKTQHVATVDVLGCRVRFDEEGRYSLNDLHRSAMAAGKATEVHSPGQFLRNAGVKEFVAVLDGDVQKSASVVSVKGGKNQGTYGVELIAIRYAAWIDPAFEVHVYQTFQQAKRDAADQACRDLERAMHRERARLEAPAMTDAIKYTRLAEGKTLAAHNFSNEFNLINRIAIGQPAKEYRVANGIAMDAPIRDYLTPRQIKCVEHLQRANATMIELGMPFESRKAQLSKLYVQRHSRALLAEVKRMEF